MSSEIQTPFDIDNFPALNSRSSSITAFSGIPYALISSEIKGSASGMLEELTQIGRYYKIYKKGAEFATEGSNGDYVPAVLRYRMASTLVNKQARFLFAEAPDMVVDSKGDAGKVSAESKQGITILNDLVKTVMDANKFEEQLIKAAKDCFIGKRVAGLVNFNEEDGVTITFLPSTQFIYDTKPGNPSVVTMFVAFIIVNEGMKDSKKIFRKRYTLENGVVFLEESIHDSAGKLIETVMEKEETLMPMIPVSVFVNDGLTGEIRGESEIALLADFERWMSKLNNADIDAQRKSMNPIRYSIDLSNQSTKNLKSSAGSYWDLQSDQNLDEAHPAVGVIESTMSYSDPLNTTLNRIRSAGYEQVDMPFIDLENMSGTITSGKALKAIYWPLIVRCKEKMKMWGPQLRQLITIIIEGARVYPNTITKYTDDTLTPVAYEINVEANHPLPEDELEEKSADLAQVAAQTMSRKAFMQKWRMLTDEEAKDELEQMAREREILEDSAFVGEV